MVDRAKQLEEMVDKAMALKEADPNYQRIKKATDEFKEFEKMMDMINKYPTKLMKKPEPSRWQYDLIQTKIQLAETRKNIYSH
jgi:hypothetical protein